MLEQVKDAVDSFVPVVRSSTARPRAQRFLDDGLIVHPSLGEIPYDKGACWREDVPRSLGRYLHGFLFLADWYESLLPESDAAVAAAADVMTTWVTANPSPPGSSEMAFHDETTAQRLLQMCHILDGWGHRFAPDMVTALVDAVRATVELLLEPRFYAGRNNHGMFQDLALLRYAAAGDTVRGASDDEFAHRCVDTAVERLYSYLTGSFTADGVHVENSPGYHLMVSRYLRDLLPVFHAADAVKAAVLEDIYRGAERFATHMLLPDGFLPPVGDTKAERVRSTGHRTTFAGPEYCYAVTQGETGAVPVERTTVFPDAGYAVHRSDWADPHADYVLFKAAYRSNYHHHADDLSLLFYTAGQLLLAEAGPYGYDYNDRLTRYAFSQYAHNTVVVDGASQARVDQNPGGVFLQDLGPSGAVVLDVEGVNARTPGIAHRRRVTVTEEGSGTVEVRDHVAHDDDAGHSYEALWHLGPDVRPLLHGHGAELYLGKRKVLELTWRAPVPVTARLITPGDQPGPRAHRFPAFGRRADGMVLAIGAAGHGLELTTTIRSSDFRYRDWGIGAAGAPWSRALEEVPLNYLLERVPGASMLVVVFSAMAPAGSFTYNYKSTLDRVNAHRLYVLDDFGDQGAYYYCDHRDLAIYRSVQKLLRRIIDELGVDLADVALVGSSKGGTAAIIHGSSLGVGRIIVGAPQIRIGSFLARPHPNVLEFMAGGTGEQDVAWLDRAVVNHVRKIRPDTSVELLIGTDDHHFRDHLPHLVSVFRSIGHDNFSVAHREGLNHADVGRAFSRFLLRRLDGSAGRLGGAGLAVHGTAVGRNLDVSTDGVAPGDYCAFYLYKGREAVRKTTYARNSGRMSFPGLEPGTYRVKVFKKSTTKSEPTVASSATVMVGA